MAHLTKKKLAERNRNALKRAFSPMNMGTRDMGYKSNNERKVALKAKIESEAIR